MTLHLPILFKARADKDVGSDDPKTLQQITKLMRLYMHPKMEMILIIKMMQKESEHAVIGPLDVRPVHPASRWVHWATR